MKPWKEVEADPQFQSLDSDQQLAAQLQYFDEVVAPQVEQADLGSAKNQFLSEFGRGPGLASAMGTGLVKEYGNTLVNRTIKGLGALASTLPGGEDVGTAAAELGTEFERQTASDFPISEEMSERFPVKAAGAVGQALGYATSTLVSGGLGAGTQGARAVGLGMAGVGGAGSGYDIAEQYGVTDPWERRALIAGGGAIEAGTEAFGGFGSKRGTEALLGRMKSATMPGSALGRAGKTIGSEALEEPVAGQVQDWLTGAIVEEDPERPGFALNGQPLPADTLSIQNLKNRLEEAALGAVGGTVFAGAEAIGARTDIDEALAMRLEARQAIKDLEARGQNLTPEETADLERLQSEDQNISSWLERKGLERVKPVLDEMASNPEEHAEALAKAAESRGDAQSAAFWRSEAGIAEIEGGAVQYQALIDNLGMVEQDPEATPEEKAQAGKAVENHALNSLINPLQKKKQEQAIQQTWEDKREALKKRVEAVSEPKPTVQAPNPSVAEVAPIVTQTTSAVKGLSPELDSKLDVLNQKLAALQKTPEPAPAPEPVAPVVPQAPLPAVPEPIPTPPAPETPAPPSSPSKVQSPKARGRRKITTNLRVSGREAENAKRRFTDIGGNVRVATVEELAQDPVFKAFWMASSSNPTEEGWNQFIASELPKAEGINDDGSGRPVIIPSQVVVYSTDVERAKSLGMTGGEAAALRVMLHENWHGVEAWLRTSPDKETQMLRRRYDDLMAEIPEDQMDSLAQRRYTELSNWREDEHAARILRSEVMAERREAARISGQKDSLVDRFMAWLRDVWMKITKSQQEPTGDELEELFQAWRRAQTAPTEGAPKASELQLSTEDMDAAYLDAVERGDMDAAQKMVDDAAKLAGYNIGPLWRADDASVPTVLDQTYSGAIYATDKQASAEAFAKQLGKGAVVRRVFLKAGKLAKAVAGREDVSYLKPDEVADLRKQGVDAVTGNIRGKEGKEYAVLSPNQIKSAEPVTYDDQGKIIPPSQRFKAESRDIRFSLPESTPQQRLQDIAKYFAYIASPTQEEGMEPTQATEEGRVFAGEDVPVEYYRYGTTMEGQMAAARDAIDILAQQSLDGMSKTLGRDILAYIAKRNPLYGLAYEPILASNMAKFLMGSVRERAQLSIDFDEAAQAQQTIASGFGAGLQSVKGTYGQLQEIADKSKELTDSKMKEAGVDSDKGMADSIKSDVVDEIKAQVPLITPEVRAPLMEAAQNDADYPLSMQFLGEENAQTYADLEGWLAEIEELLKLEAELTAGASGEVAASRPELPKNLTLAQVREMLADRKKKVENALKTLKVVMTGEDPVEQAKKTVRKRRKQAEQEKAETTDNSTFKDWVMGAESADIGTFDQEVVKYIDGNGFNRTAFSTLLSNKFKDADPNFIAGVVNRVADLLDGVATEEGIEEDQKKVPNYDARAKRIVVKSLGNKVEEAVKDPLSELTKKRLKEEIGATEFQDGVTKLGVTADTAFALSQKVDEDIAARKAVREAVKSKAEREKGQKEADALVETLGKQFSDTLSFDKKNAESAFKALVREYSTAKDAMPDDQFHSRTETLMIPKEKSETLLALLKEGRRRKDAVDTAKEIQKKAHERKLELEKNEREATAAWNALSRQLSDTPSFTSSQKSEVSSLIEKYKNKRIGEQELEDGLLKLNVTQSTASGISAALQENRRRQDVVDKAKKAQKDEEDARLKNEREVKAKLESIAKDLSDTPSLSVKQKSEVALLIEKYKKGTIDAVKLEDELKKLNVSPSTASSYVRALEENKKRESAVEYEREAERAEKKIQSEIDRLAKDLSDTVASNAKQAPSEIRKLVEEFKNFTINEKELRDRLAKLRMQQPSIDKLVQLLQINRQRQVLLTWNTIRQNVLKARERAVHKVKKAMEAKNPKKKENISTFARLLLEAANGGILDSDAVRTAFAQAYNLHGLTPARLKDLGELLQKINGLPEGMVKETFLNEFNFLLNEVAPTASFVQFSHLALMGYILGGANTMAMQLTGVGRFLNPLSGTLEMLMSGPGTPMEKIGRTVRNFFPVWFAGMKEVYNNFAQVRAGMSGLLDSQPYGVGALVSDLASTKVRETSMAWTAWGQINKARFDAPKILEKMGLGTAFKKLTMYPAWMASRSFQVIRGFESLVAGADMNIRFRVQMATARMQADPKLDFRAAWKQVSDAMGDNTSEMYKKAIEQAKDDVANKRISKSSEKQQVVQLMQNALEKRWGSLSNRHRQMAALLNYKTDPLTPLGAGLYNLMNKALQSDQRVLRYSRFGFLFARFFTNAIESAWSRTPLGGLTALMLPKSKDKLDPREERITQIFGSLSAYRDERIARAISGTTTMSFLGMLMVLALLDYDPEDDEPPLFWVTGEPMGEFGKRSIMESGGWYKSQTLYLGPLRINYVNASPELAMALSAVGGLADRFMFDRLLNYKLNKSTNEYEKDDFQAYGKPVLESLAAPLSRSTFRSFYDAIDAGFNGDFKKMTRLLSNPVVGTAVALSPAAIIPSFKSLEKVERVQDQPRSPRNAAQALAASIPFTDAGEPLVTPFGEPLSPFPFFSLLSNTQEVSPERGQAARLLAELGIDHRGPETEYLGWDLSEIAYDGDAYLLDETQRDRVLKDIGRRLANSINSEARELRSLLKEKEGRQKVRSKVSKMASEAKAEALLSFKPVR